MNGCDVLRTALLAATVACSHAIGGARTPTEQVCADEHGRAVGATGSSNAPDVRAIRRKLDASIALLRFDRRKAAEAQVRQARGVLERRPSLLPPEDRDALLVALDALARCLATSRPPEMASLTVRVFEFQEGAPGGRGSAAGSGVYVRADEIPIGRTGSDGTLSARVPSGPLRITALIYPNSFAEAAVTLAPGENGSISIVLDEGQEVADETDLELVEAKDEILPAGASSLTLLFVQDGGVVPITKIVSIEMVKPSGGSGADVQHLFRVANDRITAVNPRDLLPAATVDDRAPIRLSVKAVDANGVWHSNVVEFRVEPSR